MSPDRNHAGPVLGPHAFERRVAGPFETARACSSKAALSAASDGLLVALACEAHVEAFEVIVERHRGPLFGYCRRLIPDSRAEEAVQQTLLKAWVRLRNGPPFVTDLRAWLYRIAHNAALDVARRLACEQELVCHLADPADAAATQDDPYTEVERLMRVRATFLAINSLPPRQREALLQTAFEGKSHRQVAHELGLSEDSVSQLVRRARMALQSGHRAYRHRRRLSRFGPARTSPRLGEALAQAGRRRAA